MRFTTFACDYDGTLASAGWVAPEGIEALKRLASSGRKLVLVTGRELKDLRAVFPALKLFDRIVAENGAILYRPATGETTSLGERAPPQFVEALIERRVSPLSVGDMIVATNDANHEVVLDTIRDLGLELHVVFNKGAVMVLPSGINKGTGLASALRELGMSAHNCVAIGDAENDDAFLSISECAAAVANALPTLKQRADVVTSNEATAGVIELIDQLLSDDLRQYQSRLSRHDILLGQDQRGQDVQLQSYGHTVLIAGESGSGKSTTNGLIQRIIEQRYQCCLVDPVGDYEGLDRTVSLGKSDRSPAVGEVLQVLANPDESCVVNMVGIPLRDRPAFFATLLPRLQELRARMGRPHWIAVDEAHHILPSAWRSARLALPNEMESMLFITAEPRELAAEVLSSVNEVIAVGDSAPLMLGDFSRMVGAAVPDLTNVRLDQGEVLLWRWRESEAPMGVRVAPPASLLHQRRKYAEGELQKDSSSATASLDPQRGRVRREKP